MNSTTEKLLKGFTELCEELVSNAYIVTDGRSVVDTVLDYDLAVHLCKLSQRKYEGSDFVVIKIEDALEFAYRKGFQEAIHECGVREKERLEKTDGEDSELRERDLQQQKESD